MFPPIKKKIGSSVVSQTSRIWLAWTSGSFSCCFAIASANTEGWALLLSGVEAFFGDFKLGSIPDSEAITKSKDQSIQQLSYTSYIHIYIYPKACWYVLMSIALQSRGSAGFFPWNQSHEASIWLSSGQAYEIEWWIQDAKENHNGS